MNKYEAQTYIAEVRDLLHRAANATEPLAPADEKHLIELEDEALELFAGDLGILAITTAREGLDLAPTIGEERSDAAAGPYDGVRLEAVSEIVKWPGNKVVELRGRLQRLEYVQYVAVSAPQQLPDGREVRDRCASGPERFVTISGTVRPFGAASALAARLLEPLSQGAWPTGKGSPARSNR